MNAVLIQQLKQDTATQRGKEISSQCDQLIKVQNSLEKNNVCIPLWKNNNLLLVSPRRVPISSYILYVIEPVASFWICAYKRKTEYCHGRDLDGQKAYQLEDFIMKALPKSKDNFQVVNTNQYYEVARLLKVRLSQNLKTETDITR